METNIKDTQLGDNSCGRKNPYSPPPSSCSWHNYDIRRTIGYTSENISYLLSGAKILTFDTMNFHERMAYPWRDSRPALKSLWREDPLQLRPP